MKSLLLPFLIASFAFIQANLHAETSQLWGTSGELWTPQTSMLRDFTDVGYMGEGANLPDWPVGVDVTDLEFNAIPDDDSSDRAAILAAIAACPPYHAVFLPNGTYIIDDLIEVIPDNIVIRGESRDKTILFFPKRLMEIYPGLDADTFETSFYLTPFIKFSGGSNRGIEDISLVFRDETKSTAYVRPNRDKQQDPHWFWVGANPISFEGGEENSWMRNIYIKNSNHAIRIDQSTYITILDVVIDQFAERVRNGELASGHMGIKYGGAQNCLVYNVRFTGLWVHDNCAMGTTSNVFSRLSSDVSLRLDHHARGNQFNLYTEIDTGEGGRGYGESNNNFGETYWGIKGVLEEGYLPTNRECTMVGIKTTSPTDIGATWHHETLNPDLLVPANIYLAQMAYFNKPHVPADKVLTIPYDETKPVRLLAIADSYVDSNDPTSNFGTIDRPVFVKNGERESFIKFDLRELAQTNAGAIKLKVYSDNLWGGTLQVEGVSDDSWDEHAITWDNKPAAGSILDSVVFDEAGVSYTLDITSFVNSQLAGDKIVSLKLSESGVSNRSLNMFSRPDGASARLILYPDASTVPAPAAPTNLIAVQGDGEVILLDWDDNSEADIASYNVYRQTGTEDSKIWAMGLTTSEYADHVVDNNATYKYLVKAVDTAGTESLEGVEFSVTVVHPDAPEAPTGLSATSSNNAVFLDWADNSEPDLASYSVFRSTTSGDYIVELASDLTSSEYVDGTAVNGTTYYYVVIATDTDAYLSARSIEVSATPSGALPDTTAPVAPTGLTAVAIEGGAIRLDWGDNSEADLAGYSVYRSSTTGVYGSPLLTGITSSDYTDSTIIVGEKYFYVVTATDANSQESGQSSEVFSAGVEIRFEYSESPNQAVFASLPTVSSSDLAHGIMSEYSFTLGNWDEALLTDGLPNGRGFNVTARAGTGPARYLIDLGSLQKIDMVNSYSYAEGNDTAAQKFSLYGSAIDTTGTAAEFNEADSAWTLIATVDVSSLDRVARFSYGVSSINRINSDYRELMWVAEMPYGFVNTVWKEFDVIAPIGYSRWATSYGVGTATDDFDNDGASNFLEYAFDGNPADSLNRGTLPTLTRSGNALLYVYPKRSDDTSLTYTVETTTDLASIPWGSEGYTVTETEITGNILDFITNEIDTSEEQRFIRLSIQE
jgi:fibronectin type 3 domain-containing protein